MHPYEVAEKLKAAQALGYAENCQQATTARGIGDCAQNMAQQEPLVYHLQRKARNAEENHVKITRVLDILQRHPEFEEFLEILRSDLV